ncbi:MULTISPECIES: 2-oxo acid dehydrogenase subunit E2 [unclassified Corallococcus]|uniref:2-oxo acid dehydrogenase subunit E2 n=1 Tax=unclassified Corallococcus TaxID=2685029 RepID=UPI001A8F53BF|nr:MULTISPECIES: 2-oxo acid dehydrogenase subunit E2 [unclassified Corallococcus]MBN9686814.1 2-oxo acid dehydrogenase subunit E2 [Corallococcus sp. NCSPR001]WAS81774.1 2-oxo acid dehydrogenase subunit E2 [Corallococcus sp. NCRR]
MAHLELKAKRDVSSFRKLAIGSWATAYDPTVYGTLSVRMDAALAWLEAFHQRTGVRLTATHLVIKAMGEALRRCPDANALLRYQRIYLRQRITVCAVLPGADQRGLTPVRIEDVDTKSVHELALEVESTAARVREGRDARVEQGRSLLKRVPHLLLHRFTGLVSFLTYTLNVDPSWLGLPRDPFGAAVVVDVGELGLETAYLPLAPFTRVPIFLAPGAVREVAVVEEGRVVPGHVMNINASFDHRFLDGYHAGVIASTLREMLEHPVEAFGPLPDPSAE